MFVLEEPYVSPYLQKTVIETQAPVLDNAVARSLLAGTSAQLTSEADFVRMAEAGALVYANSENVIGWVETTLRRTALPAQVHVLKDKRRFRELLRDLYPDHRFASVPCDALHQFDPATMCKPFIVKPAVGFFSLGVRKVLSDEAWPAIAAALQRDARAIRTQYPSQVLDCDAFIVEECVPGDEYAVDAYYDAAGRPVVVNILAHHFGGEEDVSDRVYTTSCEVVETYRERFARALADVGQRADLRNFPVHAELRVDHDGALGFIEINPMRFAGWCCTDIAQHAYGVNPYRCFLEQTAPDWESILRERRGRAWHIVVADLPQDLDRSAIVEVDYEAFLANFSAPLELRRVDFTRYSAFAFLFTETAVDATAELDAILQADLRRYCRMWDEPGRG